MSARAFGELPLWRRILLIMLIPLVLPVSLLFVLCLLLGVSSWNSIIYGIYWVRWKVFGTPIPPLGPTAGS
jgi:hypothetical protein